MLDSLARQGEGRWAMRILTVMIVLGLGGYLVGTLAGG